MKAVYEFMRSVASTDFCPTHSFLGYVTRKKPVTATAAVRRRARDELYKACVII